MNIAVIGAGAIGSVVASYLTKAGVSVTLIGRPDQVTAIRKSGLHVMGVRGEETFQFPALMKLDKAYDVVIFTVKTQDLESAYLENQDHLESGFILTTQNGVQADNVLSSHFERDKLISSIVMFGATYVRPGEVTFNFEGDWIIGKPYFPNDPFVHELAGVLQKAFKVNVSNDIMGMKWLKLFINFNNCIPALLGKSMQETFADLDFCRLSMLLLKEGIEVTRKAGVKLVSLPQFPVERIDGLSAMPVEQGAAIVNKTLTGLSKEPLYGSILQSIMRKKTSEIDFINGEVAHLAQAMGLSAPLNRKIVDLVHEVEREGKFFSRDEVKRKFSLSSPGDR